MTCRGRGTLTAMLVAVGTAAAATTADAAPAKLLAGLHDQRYCEIFEVKGAPPAASVTVYNTVGLNTCPAARWTFDAAALAKELGDTAVVLNGPRHWLMDSVLGTAGRVKSFHGLRMRQVAKIPVRTASDLVAATYTDRTIARTNTWRWNAGRRVYELVAPGGDTYVMQSYAQTKDPRLTIAKLSGLAKRLKLPEGWRYRTRVLRTPLALVAKGSTTVIQDDLANTYQLATTVRKGPRRQHAVRLHGRTATVAGANPAPGGVEDRGSMTGPPFGTGTLVLDGVFGGGRLTGVARLRFPTGSILVRFALPFTLSGTDEIDFLGTGHLAGGTGAFRGATGDLRLHDHNTLDGQHGVVEATGTVTY